MVLFIAHSYFLVLPRGTASCKAQLENQVVFSISVHVGVYQISRQIKAHDGSVFTLCQMRNGMLLTGGGKDRKIILWDHDMNPEREIEVRKQERQGNCQELGTDWQEILPALWRISI